ncbi:MAG TPA: HAD family hydrolase [Candidatus Thermoplasmatota archaeon]|nr:HAD family hydrolase [Candidatus Thermoplasmatota archaeon]
MQPVLLFDLVGTLVDEASDYEALDAAMDAARLRFGLQDEASALSGDFSLALMEILRDEGEADGEPAEFIPFERAAKDIFAAVMEVRGVEAGPEDVAWFWATFLDAQRRLVRVHADALPALDWSRRHGFRLGLLTDADPYFVTDVLASTGLPRRFDFVVTAAEAGEPKPGAAIFRLAMERAQAPPVQAIMVGDSYERDVLGARAAGISRAILVDRHRARTVRDVPIVASLAGLPNVVAKLAPGVN